MISLVKQIPTLSMHRAEVVKINCNFNLYPEISLFWVQDNYKAVISMLDDNMVIYNNSANIEELREFIGVISPASVFSDADTLIRLFGQDFHRVNVMKCEHRFETDVKSHAVNSQEIYTLLNVNGLELPPYEYFAVDFCHKLNHGSLKYFAIKDLCAAVGICDRHTALVNGIASHQKGMGSTALCGLLSQFDTPSLAVCKKDVVPFYLKNNFSLAYYAGYWRKNS